MAGHRDVWGMLELDNIKLDFSCIEQRDSKDPKILSIYAGTFSPLFSADALGSERILDVAPSPLAT